LWDTPGRARLPIAPKPSDCSEENGSAIVVSETSKEKRAEEDKEQRRKTSFVTNTISTARANTKRSIKQQGPQYQHAMETNAVDGTFPSRDPIDPDESQDLSVTPLATALQAVPSLLPPKRHQDDKIDARDPTPHLRNSLREYPKKRGVERQERKLTKSHLAQTTPPNANAPTSNTTYPMTTAPHSDAPVMTFSGSEQRRCA
jgi:hypothetical protein